MTREYLVEDLYADKDFTAKDFQVNPPVSNDRLDAYASAIRDLEPALRSAGKVMDFELLTVLTDTGQLTGLDDPGKLSSIVKLF